MCTILLAPYCITWKLWVSFSWIQVVPWSIRKLLNWLKENYNDPEIIITENGYSDDGSSLDDDGRISYHQRYLSNIRLAMEDGVKVVGYTAWSLMDNFEWIQGYRERFGFYSVNFNDPDRTRTPKKSVDYYKNIIGTRCLVDSFLKQGFLRVILNTETISLGFIPAVLLQSEVGHLRVRNGTSIDPEILNVRVF
ncbi:hypothetical protein NQ318_018839 [Aromia moschata]|uniref:Uncharacterized protein n=1 Tax=Aromia moschata TaxID=1265417 RepID=A0AAV8ZI05_9CUCU|nr:hypothetical protein NQ318_018839 [Aromia moschata]